MPVFRLASRPTFNFGSETPKLTKTLTLEERMQADAAKFQAAARAERGHASPDPLSSSKEGVAEPPFSLRDSCVPFRMEPPRGAESADAHDDRMRADARDDDLMRV